MSDGGIETANTSVQIRVATSIMKEVDEYIKNGEFPSRSEFFKRIAIEWLAVRRKMKEFEGLDGPARKLTFLEELKDPDVREEIYQIFKERL
ncbi:MAG: hypothetical protein JXA44_04085 [Methanospirillaceae archaeon]|nr:hypothetical protein [Methanospirillaceae archaeon]